ncbi:unnamed protein product [Trichobilharzia szidati]|nr:unnamed protein product [Trichobilharzia szidati]
MGLEYDPVSKTTKERDLCNVEFPGWGDTWASEYLTEEKYSPSIYLKLLVDALTEDSYFIRNKTLRAAPYDFRKTPHENLKYFDKLKQLIEETYENGENRPVYLLAHSMGSLYSMYFLKQQTKDWKQRYIRGFISVSAPFGGSMEALYSETCGNNFAVPARTPFAFREAERSFPAMAFLLPDPRLWSEEEKVIITPNKNYSVHDMKAMFEDMSFPSGYLMMQEGKKTIDTLERPTDVDIYCIYGVQLPTISQMIFSTPGKFRSSFPNHIPLIKYGDGDGMVNIRSLSVCNNWKSVNAILLPHCSHEDILKDKRLIATVKRLLNIN